MTMSSPMLRGIIAGSKYAPPPPVELREEVRLDSTRSAASSIPLIFKYCMTRLSIENCDEDAMVIDYKTIKMVKNWDKKMERFGIGIQNFVAIPVAMAVQFQYYFPQVNEYNSKVLQRITLNNSILREWTICLHTHLKLLV